MNFKSLGLVSKFYETLVESDRGPVVALHGSTVVTQFGLDKLYVESVQILYNFINKCKQEGFKGIPYNQALDARRVEGNIPRDPRVVAQHSRKLNQKLLESI